MEVFAPCSTLEYAGHLSWLLHEDTEMAITKATNDSVISFFII